MADKKYKTATSPSPAGTVPRPSLPPLSTPATGWASASSWTLNLTDAYASIKKRGSIYKADEYKSF